MVLADTNVFIDFWNNPTEELVNCFETEEIVICGVIKAELLHGAVSDKDFANITSMLEAFDEKEFEKDDWQLLGNNLYMLRRNGITVPISDAIIATLAIKNNLMLWTNDRHFALMQKVFPNLQLYGMG